MKAILMSIHPQWCEKIFNGEKTIEVRKNRPSIEPPFKVYVYCTKAKNISEDGLYLLPNDRTLYLGAEERDLAFVCIEGDFRNGKVVGSFVCDDIISDWHGEHSDEFVKYALLSLDEQKKYGGNKPLYGWHITEPRLFDRPRELREFRTWLDYRVIHAPQSWVYVEEEE